MAELIVRNTPASPSLSPRVAARASFSRRCSELTVSLGPLWALYNSGLAHRAEPSRGTQSEASPVLNIRDNTCGPPVVRQPTSWGVALCDRLSEVRANDFVAVDGCRRFCRFTFRQAQKLWTVVERL